MADSEHRLMLPWESLHSSHRRTLVAMRIRNSLRAVATSGCASRMRVRIIWQVRFKRMRRVQVSGQSHAEKRRFVRRVHSRASI